jgi:glycosyltransferase involved in cell wall biosynthesis
MFEPLVSVIIPTYNRASLLVRAVESVLVQTHRNTELIIVDDGSTDDTATILRGYGHQLRLFQQENAGPAAARNRGIAAANGDFIAFLDSDDYWLPTKLERQLRALEHAGFSSPCCLCDCSIVDPDGETTSAFAVADIIPEYLESLWLNPAEVLSTRFVLFNQAIIIRRPVLDRIGYFDERLKLYYEDYDLALRLSLEGPWAVVSDQLVVYQDSAPGSLAKRALEDEVVLCRHRVRVRERFLETVKRARTGEKLHKLARLGLQSAKWELVTAQLGEHRLAAYLGICSILRFTSRMKKAILRRSPRYPMVLVRDLATVSRKS